MNSFANIWKLQKADDEIIGAISVIKRQFSLHFLSFVKMFCQLSAVRKYDHFKEFEYDTRMPAVDVDSVKHNFYPNPDHATNFAPRASMYASVPL